MLVWNMSEQKWVRVQQWMRYCPYIWTKGILWDEIEDKKNEPTITR